MKFQSELTKLGEVPVGVQCMGEVDVDFNEGRGYVLIPVRKVGRRVEVIRVHTVTAERDEVTLVDTVRVFIRES